MDAVGLAAGQGARLRSRVEPKPKGMAGGGRAAQSERTGHRRLLCQRLAYCWWLYRKSTTDKRVDTTSHSI